MESKSQVQRVFNSCKEYTEKLFTNGIYLIQTSKDKKLELNDLKEYKLNPEEKNVFEEWEREKNSSSPTTRTSTKVIKFILKLQWQRLLAVFILMTILKTIVFYRPIALENLLKNCMGLTGQHPIVKSLEAGGFTDMESYSLIEPGDMKCKPFKGLAPADKILLQLPGWYSDFTCTCDAPIELDHWSAMSADTWSAIRVDPTFVNWVQHHFAKSYTPSLSVSPNLPTPHCSTCATCSSVH